MELEKEKKNGRVEADREERKGKTGRARERGKRRKNL